MQERPEIAVVAHEAVHGGDRVELRLQGLVLRDQVRQDVASLAGQQLAGAGQADFLHG